MSDNSLEYERYSGRSMAKSAVVQPQVAVANGRKKVDEEISRYLDDMVASKRPGKSVRMKLNFLNAFAKLIGKEYVDQDNRSDVIKFRKRLFNKDDERKYIDTQMNFVLTLFKRWIKLPIQMKRGDRLEYGSVTPDRVCSSMKLSSSSCLKHKVKGVGLHDVD